MRGFTASETKCITKNLIYSSAVVTAFTASACNVCSSWQKKSFEDDIL